MLVDVYFLDGLRRKEEGEEGEDEEEGRRTYSVEPSGDWNPVLIIVAEESADAKVAAARSSARAARSRSGLDFFFF